MKRLILMLALLWAAPGLAGTLPCTTAIFVGGETVTSSYLNNCSWLGETFTAEGSTADADEWVIDFADPTEDYIGRFPNIGTPGTYTFAFLDAGQTFVSPGLSLPNILGKYDLNNTAVDDDDCTGEQGKGWYDSTDSAWEFCNANTGAPATIAATSGDVTRVGDCTTGDCFITGGSGTKLDSDGNFVIELDANNDGTATLSILDGAGSSKVEIDEDGDITATSFTADPSATPTWGFQDSDMGGTPDTNASIAANCPTGTTAGADEDCDLAFNTQIGGVLTEAFRIDTTDAAVQTVIYAKATDLVNDDVVDSEVELTEEECSVLFTPGSTIADTYDVKTVWRAPVAVTVTEVYCETDTGTVNFDFQIDDGTPADIMGTDLVCDATGETDNTGLTGSMVAGDRLDFEITSVASSPVRLTACVVYTR